MGNTMQCQPNCCDKGSDSSQDNVASGDLARATMRPKKNPAVFNHNEIVATEGKYHDNVFNPTSPTTGSIVEYVYKQFLNLFL